MLRALLLGALAAQSAIGQPGAPVLRVTETLRIDGATEDIASGSTNFWLGRDGRMAAFDGPTVRFIFFDSTGKRLGTFGARGDGPGEFAARTSGPPSLQTGLVGDTMWVYSAAQRRFTLIAPDLKLKRTLTLPQYDAAAILSFRPLALLANDRVLGRATFGERVGVTLADGRSGVSTKASDSGAFTPTGDLIGTVKFPRKGLSMQTATRTTIWATETDADGFMSVVRFRVDSRGGGQ